MEVVPSDKPLDKHKVIAIRCIEIDVWELDPDLGLYAKAWSTRQWKKEVAVVWTMYKWKDWKIRPMDIPLPRGVNPGGGANTGGVLSEGEMWSDVGVMDESESWRLEGTRVS